MPRPADSGHAYPPALRSDSTASCPLLSKLGSRCPNLGKRPPRMNSPGPESPSSVFIKKEVLDNVGAFDESLRGCEDYDLWLRITAKYPVVFLDVPLIYKYGGHADQLSKVNDGIEFYRIQSLEKIINSGFLGDEQKVMAVNALVNKVKIYCLEFKRYKKMHQMSIQMINL